MAELTQEILDDCVEIAKTKFSEVQVKVLKGFKQGRHCTAERQLLKTLAVWEDILTNYELPAITPDPNCRINEGCLSDEQVTNICDKIKSINI
jgi:hypothetical protein